MKDIMALFETLIKGNLYVLLERRRICTERSTWNVKSYTYFRSELLLLCYSLYGLWSAFQWCWNNPWRFRECYNSIESTEFGIHVWKLSFWCSRIFLLITYMELWVIDASILFGSVSGMRNLLHSMLCRNIKVFWVF